MSTHPETIALHAGWRADPATHAVAVPIYQTTSFQFDSAEHAANLFSLKELGNIYTRIMNPTTDVLEKRVAALEGGVAALGLASGQAASAFAVQNLARAGDNIVSSTDLYGGTWNLFANTLKDQGIEVRFVDPQNPEAFANATDDKTRAYYAETLPNPKLIPFPIARRSSGSARHSSRCRMISSRATGPTPTRIPVGKLFSGRRTRRVAHELAFGGTGPRLWTLAITQRSQTRRRTF